MSLKDTQATFPLSSDELAPLHKPIMDPYVPSGMVHLTDRDGVGDQVTVTLDDVVLLQHDDGKLTLSRLGIINALLDQAVPGLRLIAHVTDPDEPGDDGNYGLSLQRI